MNLKDNHIQMAKDFVEAGLLGDEDIPDKCPCPCGGAVDKYAASGCPSLNPEHPDFDRNANEVMRRWKETFPGSEGQGWYHKAFWMLSIPENHGRIDVLLNDILTTPTLWLNMIWETMWDE